MKVEFPEQFKFLFEPYRYKISYGGRGSAKSWQYARALLILACTKKLRIVCAREFQNSISKSVYQLLMDQIGLMGLEDVYTITKNDITCNITGSTFIFVGLRNNVTSIKSLEGANIVWVEEAETISEFSWCILLPTVQRTKGAEVWISFNPLDETDPTYVRFVKNPPKNSYVVKVNWRDNPWLTQEMIDLKDDDMNRDIDLYNWIWEGECRIVSDALIFNKKIHIDDFKPNNNWNGPYYGIDWGFANDPTVMIKCWVYNNDLYIEEELVVKGTITENLADIFMRHDSRCKLYTIRADCARPETIAGVQKYGFNKLIPCKKWSGSVEDGIHYLKTQFNKIIINPNCTNMILEARNYKYKVDRLSGDIQPIIVDAYNHGWDAVRYALEPLITNTRPGGVKIYS